MQVAQRAASPAHNGVAHCMVGLAGIGQPAVCWQGDGFWVLPIAPRPRNVVRRHDLQDDVEEVFDIVSIVAIVRGGGRVDPRIPAISRVRPHSGAL